jgi:valyl-tRNA synthetase
MAEDIDTGLISNSIDLWCVDKLNNLIREVSEQLDQFEYLSARVAIENFFWKIFCDNYLEIIKRRAYNEDKTDDAGQKSAICTIYHIMNILLRLIAPILPFISEKIFSELFPGQFNSIHQKDSWPIFETIQINYDIIESGDNFLSILAAVRKFKAEQNKSISVPIKILEIIKLNPEFKFNEELLEDLKNVTNSNSIKIKNGDKLVDSAEHFSINVILSED